ADCVIWRVVPQSAEWQHVTDEINAAMIFAWANLAKLLNRFHCEREPCCRPVVAVAVAASAGHEDHQQHVPLFSRDRQGTSVPSSTRVPRWQLLKVCASFSRFNHTQRHAP